MTKNYSGLLALFAGLLYIGCSQNSVQPPANDKGMAFLKITAAAGSPFKTLAKKATLSISAGDMPAMTTSLTVTDSSVEGTISGIPAGKNRLFAVSVVDSFNTLQYKGSTLADIIADSTVRVSITLLRISGNAIFNDTVVDQFFSGMKLIPGGTFSMGTDDSLLDQGAQPVHQVTLDSFYIDSTEVTQREYYDLQVQFYGLMNNPAYWASLYNPVESVSWFDAVLCANARSKRYHLDTVYTYSAAFRRVTESGISCSTLTNLSYDLSKKGYRLPTEAEWEYACRAGTTTQCYWGTQASIGTVDMYAWFVYNSARMPHQVGQKSPNFWGLYDMIGNVQEWCNDWHIDGYTPAPAVNPVGPATGTERIMRGGAYTENNTTGSLARSATRKKNSPEKYRSTCGFRLVIPK